jgi:hypothetical protein
VMNNPRRKSSPVTTLANPVRAPAAGYQRKNLPGLR